MSACCSDRRFAGAEGFAERFSDRVRCHGGPPLPLKALAVGGAFWLFPPLGVAALALMVARRRRDGAGGCETDGEAAREPRFVRRFRRRWSSGNSAFDAAQVETLKRMAEEAEAFDDFRRREHEARDREVYERFGRERAATKTPPADEPGAPA